MFDLYFLFGVGLLLLLFVTTKALKIKQETKDQIFAIVTVSVLLVIIGGIAWAFGLVSNMRMVG